MQNTTHSQNGEHLQCPRKRYENRVALNPAIPRTLKNRLEAHVERLGVATNAWLVITLHRTLLETAPPAEPSVVSSMHHCPWTDFSDRVTLRLTVSEELRDKMDARARAQDMSRNAWVIKTIYETLQQLDEHQPHTDD